MKFSCHDSQDLEVNECGNTVVRVGSEDWLSCAMAAGAESRQSSKTINMKKRTRHPLLGTHTSTAIRSANGDLWAVETRRVDQMVGLESLARVEVLPRRSEWPTRMSGRHYGRST